MSLVALRLARGTVDRAGRDAAGVSDAAMVWIIRPIGWNFAGLALNDGRIPDESTILQFPHLLACHPLRQKWFEAVQGHLHEQGYHLSRGTMVDATLIEASGSMKHQACERDRHHARVRARVAHVFSIIRCQFGYRQARYKGLAKNRAQVMSRVALANISVLPVIDGRLTGALRLQDAKGVRKQQKARWSVPTRDRML